MEEKAKTVNSSARDEAFIRSKIKELEEQQVSIIPIDVAKMTLKPISQKCVEIAC